MEYTMISPSTIKTFLSDLDASFGREGNVFLIGETSHVFEGWRSWTRLMEICAHIPGGQNERFERLAHETAKALGIQLLIESPAELIPLPEGYEERALPLSDEILSGCRLSFFHFDPYSVAFRYIARGDEPDYHIALMMLEKGWTTMEESDAKLEKLLPSFTSETIQQDPAEFRRKYKGLKQMWKAHGPRTTHRISEA